MAQVDLTVTGMKCGGCESNIKGKLEALAGVSNVEASFKDNRVSVEFDEAETDVDEISDVITQAGFTVEED